MTGNNMPTKSKKRFTAGCLFFIIVFSVTVLSLYILDTSYITSSVFLYYCLPIFLISVVLILFKARIVASFLLFFSSLALVALTLIVANNIKSDLAYFSVIVVAAITAIGFLLGLTFETMKKAKNKSKAIKIERKKANQTIYKIKSEQQKAIATMSNQLDKSKSEIENLKQQLEASQVSSAMSTNKTTDTTATANSNLAKQDDIKPKKLNDTNKNSVSDETKQQDNAKQTVNQADAKQQDGNSDSVNKTTKQQDLTTQQKNEPQQNKFGFLDRFLKK